MSTPHRIVPDGPTGGPWRSGAATPRKRGRCCRPPHPRVAETAFVLTGEPSGAVVIRLFLYFCFLAAGLWLGAQYERVTAVERCLNAGGSADPRGFCLGPAR